MAIELPIREKEEDIKQQIRDEQVVIIAGETGSGKTTQLPQFCRELGLHRRGRIAVTQPRRIAATSTAQRVAEELGSALGDKVGYKIRFSQEVQAQTDTVFMTDGLLLNEIARDRMLRDYSVVIIDEAHERSLNIDILLAFLRRLMEKRRDIKIIISSATIDTELFSRHFEDAPIISVSGRMYPVEILYDPPEEEQDYIQKTLAAVDAISAEDMHGDILIFMPTERDIREVCEKLAGRQQNSSVLPLFARLGKKEQNRIFTRSSRRKIIGATNIAETSLTIPGISFVVDTGLARINRYSPSLRTNRLPVEQISKAEANQRAGRSGRMAGGICIRLYTEKEFSSFSEFRTAEIRRSNLAGVVLSLLNYGITSVEEFPFPEKPSSQAVRDAFVQLWELGAIDTKRRLTSLGKSMARLPLEPHISRMMLQAKKEHISHEAALICAALSIVDPRERPKDKAQEADERHRAYAGSSDFTTLLHLWEAYHDAFEKRGSQSAKRAYCRENFLNYKRMREWGDVYGQIRRILKITPHSSREKFSSPQAFETALHRTILSGLVSSVATYDREEKCYRATRNRLVYLFPGSVIVRAKETPPWIMAHEIVETSRVFARGVAPIDPAWIVELFPHLIKKTHGPPFYDAEKETVLCTEQRFFSGLQLASGRKRFYGNIDPVVARDMYMREALVEGAMVDPPAVIAENRKRWCALQEEQAKIRSGDYICSPEELVQMYAERLGTVASTRDLAGVLRKKGSRFLHISEEEMCITAIPDAAAAFPDAFTVGSHSFPLSYAFTPGKEQDGITVRIPAKESVHLSQEAFSWVVSPLWAEKIEALLRQLPKAERKRFVPLSESGRFLAGVLDTREKDFLEALLKSIRKEYGISISRERFSEAALPEHLRLRIVLHTEGEEVFVTRDAAALGDKMSLGDGAHGRIQKEIQEQERRGIISWDMEEIPRREIISHSSEGIPLWGYPALVPDTIGVRRTVYTEEEKAIEAHYRGVSALLKTMLRSEWRYCKKELRIPKKLHLAAHPYGGEKKLCAAAAESISEAAFRAPLEVVRQRPEYEDLLKGRKMLLRRAGSEFSLHMERLLEQLRKNYDFIEKLSAKNRGIHREKIARELRDDLDIYMEQFTDGFCPYEVYQYYPRYMTAFYYRIEKAFTAPAKYAKLIAPLHEYQDAVAHIIEQFDNFRVPQQYDLLHLLFMIEELGVQFFCTSPCAHGVCRERKESNHPS
ncbi:ATP-dependent RNA helicase HrpA [Chitinivibrio alkaliphilus]|uniref:RNA helicase n=1 Tax=Chitinivibrio alkaliphilus ACht1 TaxID=1313304 RepID=U7D320_9BACT|nr:ATP-dependent RNA helicase HrpA [Chitinivibrio alkaliphilus]ERP30889.1 ATP-dependent RNA helicase HrpA [Chitinivibrio alkaliphilus ACht1]